MQDSKKLYQLSVEDKHIICTKITREGMERLSDAQAKELLSILPTSEILDVFDNHVELKELGEGGDTADIVIEDEDLDKLVTTPETSEFMESITKFLENENKQKAKKEAKRVKREQRRQKRIIIAATIVVTLAILTTTYASFKSAKKKDPNWTPARGIKSAVEDIVTPDKNKDINTYDSMNPEDNPELYGLGAGLSAEEAFPGTARH